MVQFLRYCSVIADGAQILDPGTVSPGSTEKPGLRVRFEISQWTMLTPNILKLMVTNPSPTTAQAFVKKEYKHIQIDAGYQDGHGIVYSGNIVQAIYGRENPTDTLLTIYAGDGDHGHNYATVNTTLPPGSTPQDHVNVAMRALSPYGISQGFIGIDLSTPKYPRAVTLFGMAADVLRNVAKGKQATVSYQNEKMTMVQNGSGAPGGAIVLNSNTGLIGMPTQTLEGIYARALINPSIKIHSYVQIDQKDVQGAYAPITTTGQEQITQSQLAPIATDGLYTVYRIDMNGDTRGEPWYMDLKMIATNSPATPAQKEATTIYLGST